MYLDFERYTRGLANLQKAILVDRGVFIETYRYLSKYTNVFLI